MKHPILIPVIILAVLLLIIFTVTLICYILVFYSANRKRLGEDEYEIPDGRIYEAHRDQMVAWMKKLRSMPHEEVSIKSFDGLTLNGRYYECKKGEPIEILFHGYRGSSERDLCGGVERCFALERNTLIVDQRASGESEGHTITFGIKEHRDCLAWVDFAIKKFGEDSKIIIAGISMGAATVSLAAGKELPPNVVCVLADCGYSSAKEIICKIVREMRLPVWLFYPFIKLGARVFGGFDLEETSPIDAVKHARVPMIFLHGDTDDFVPYYMSQELFDACASKNKALVTIEGAGHGLAFLIAPEKYLDSIRAFQKECGF